MFCAAHPKGPLSRTASGFMGFSGTLGLFHVWVKATGCLLLENDLLLLPVALHIGQVDDNLGDSGKASPQLTLVPQSHGGSNCRAEEPRLWSDAGYPS